MTLADLFIVYLSFGAPLAVYEYLQSRASSRQQRMVSSLVTFLFWVPAAIRIGRRYFLNAYSDGDFVSGPFSDSHADEISDLSERLKAELVRSSGQSGMRDIREVVDRYVGLTEALNDGDPVGQGDLFEAAGRPANALGRICLTRRNRHRLEVHHSQARRDFIELLEPADLIENVTTFAIAIELAKRLNDLPAIESLGRFTTRMGEVCYPKQDQQTFTSANAPTGSQPLIATTASLTAD